MRKNRLVSITIVTMFVSASLLSSISVKSDTFYNNKNNVKISIETYKNGDLVRSREMNLSLHQINELYEKLKKSNDVLFSFRLLRNYKIISPETYEWILQKCMENEKREILPKILPSFSSDWYFDFFTPILILRVGMLPIPAPTLSLWSFIISSALITLSDSFSYLLLPAVAIALVGSLVPMMGWSWPIKVLTVSIIFWILNTAWFIPLLPEVLFLYFILGATAWLFSHPFFLKPGIICFPVSLGGLGGTVITRNYEGDWGPGPRPPGAPPPKVPALVSMIGFTGFRILIGFYKIICGFSDFVAIYETRISGV